MAVLGDVADLGMASTVVDRPRDEPPRLVHVPALDGLRGLAVAAVLLFHLEHLDGGFLGVDLFFVLSGYLITSLLLVEHQGRGAVSLGRFWARRARRLLPALFTLLIGVSVLLVRFTPASQRPRFRGDALATLGYVANWHRLVVNISYWDIFNQPSPLDHTWSLAIEEQFYVLWPLVVVVLLSLAGPGRRPAIGDRALQARRLGWAALAGAAASFALMWTSYSFVDSSRAYFATDTRIGAILLGAALACWVARWRATGGGPASASRPWAVGSTVIGGAGLAWMCWSVVTVDGLSPWYYRGGLLTFAVASLAVILAVTTADGLLARLVALPPLRGLGVISYGVYLWHWPVDVYVTSERANLAGWWLDVVRIGITLAVALVSYVVIEQPIRHGALRGWPIRIGTGAAVACSLVAVLVATAGTRAATPDETLGFGPVPVGGSDNPYLLYPAEIPDGAMRVLVVGDSGAHNLGPRLVEAARDNDAVVASSAPYHCNVTAPEGILRLPDGTTMNRGHCHSRRRALWSDLVDRFDPDVVVYYLANAGSPAKSLIDGHWVHDCDPSFDRYMARALEDDAQLLGRDGALVVLATSPYSRIPEAGADHRIDCRNAVYRNVVAETAGTAIADMQTFVEDQTQVPDDEVFQDLVHLSVDGGRAVATWLLPELRSLLAASR